jgi:hypothetical protein
LCNGLSLKKDIVCIKNNRRLSPPVAVLRLERNMVSGS